MKKLTIDYKILGSLLAYYRKEKGISRKDLLILSDCDFSYATLRRIEEGDYASYDKYLYLIELLNFQISDNNETYIKLNELVEETHSIINSGKHLSEYILLKNRINKFLKSYTSNLYIREISELCINVIEIYLSCKKPDERIVDITENCLVISDNRQIKDLSSYLLFMYGIYYLRSDKKYANYISYHKNVSNNRIMLLNAPFYDFNTIGVINTFQKYCSCSFDIKDINPINTYMFNFIKAYSYGYVEDFSSAEKCINEIEKINDLNLIIPKGSLMHFYKTKGYIQYNLSKYKESFESLKHVYELNERSLEIAYMFLFKSAELSGNIDFIIKALKNEKTSSKIVYSIHEYYRNKYINNAKEIELSKYIVENFSTKRCNSKICCRFFLDELFQLTEKTRQYKLYFKYLLSLKEYYIKKKEEFIFD